MEKRRHDASNCRAVIPTFYLSEGRCVFFERAEDGSLRVHTDSRDVLEIARSMSYGGELMVMNYGDPNELNDKAAVGISRICPVIVGLGTISDASGEEAALSLLDQGFSLLSAV